VTGACVIEVVHIGGPEPDYDRAVSNDDLVQALLAATRPTRDGEFVEDVPPRGTDAIGI
jgi:hypothetical protein